MKNEKKVSMVIDQRVYQKLSDYTKRYGTTVRHMAHMLLEDSIEHDRYRWIFSDRHNLAHAIEQPKPSPILVSDGAGGVMPLVGIKKDLSEETSASEADEIIDELNDEFMNKDINKKEEENKPISDTAIDEDDKDLDFKIFLGEK